MLNFWCGTEGAGTRTIFIRAGTTYLHSPSTDKIGTVACLIRAVPKIERSVNGPIERYLLQYFNFVFAPTEYFTCSLVVRLHASLA